MMNWSYRDEILEIKTKNGKYFDAIFESGHPVILDYSYTDRELEISNDGLLSMGKVKYKEELCSIQALKQTFYELILTVVAQTNKNGTYPESLGLDRSLYDIRERELRIEICEDDLNLLTQQLVFDILFDKYVSELPMTLHQYSLYLSSRLPDGADDEAIRRCLKTGQQKQSAILNTQELREQIKLLGIDPDQYLHHFTEVGTPFAKRKTPEIVKKPKIIWDYMYYNATQKQITSKQYARSFIDNRNYSRVAVKKQFDAYDEFVASTFMQPAKNEKDYFMNSLEFYALEIYKRIDFIYKLSVRLESQDGEHIDQIHPLVKRFHPKVINRVDPQGNQIVFNTINKYYRPMLMIEEQWQQEKRYEDSMYLDMWQKYHFVRAKAYEVFRYHYKFESNDYNDISQFIRTDFNVLHYHEPNKIWIQSEKRLKAEREARIIKALEINEALFGRRQNRNHEKK